MSIWSVYIRACQLQLNQCFFLIHVTLGVKFPFVVGLRAEGSSSRATDFWMRVQFLRNLRRPVDLGLVLASLQMKCEDSPGFSKALHASKKSGGHVPSVVQ